MVMSSSIWEEAREFWLGKQKTKTPVKEKAKEEFKDEYIGPDTSSLTAFLVSLLSFSEPSGSFNGTEMETAEVVERQEDEGSSCSKNNVGESEQELKLETSVVKSCGGMEKDGRKEEDSVSSMAGGDDFDSDWQLVSEKDLSSSEKDLSRSGKDLVSPKCISQPPTGQVLQQQFKPHPAGKLLKLPSMSEESVLLPENLRSVIYTSLPTLAQGRQWVLLYSTMKHGISLRTLYQKSGIIPGPCLLVASDRFGAIFGGLISSPLKPIPNKRYQGTNESFVFTNVTGNPQVFRSTGINRYYVLCTNEAIALGGGGHFALHLDSELLYGSSASCETYGNASLATTEEFVVKNVELWGFAHTSRYVPVHASFKEPEVVRGICDW